MPPAIPGLGAAGGFSLWLQDRTRRLVDFLNENLQKFLEAARKRPELGNVNSTFRAAVPQTFVDVDRDKALKQGVPVADVYQTLQTFLGGTYVNQFNRFGRQWRVFMQAEAGGPRETGGHRGVLRAQQRRQHGAALGAHDDPPDGRARVHAALQPLSRRAGHRAARPPGYSSGQAMAALEDVAAKTLPREIGYDWSDLSYQEKKASGTTGRIFGLSLVFVFLILAALYESWSLPLQRPPLGARRRLRRVPRPPHAALRLRRLRADRPHRAHRPRGEERDPDRRVREGRAREGQGPRRRPPSRARSSASGRSS
jgi:HAE1 family hydrophobic/amphiphilic exporter-1